MNDYVICYLKNGECKMYGLLSKRAIVEEFLEIKRLSYNQDNHITDIRVLKPSRNGRKFKDITKKIKKFLEI